MDGNGNPVNDEELRPINLYWNTAGADVNGKTACSIAGFALFAGILYVLALYYDGPAIALAIGAFALIAAGIATRKWLSRSRGARMTLASSGYPRLDHGAQPRT